MKNLKTFALSAIALAVLTGCTDHDDPEALSPQPIGLNEQGEIELDSPEHFTMSTSGEIETSDSLYNKDVQNFAIGNSQASTDTMRSNFLSTDAENQVLLGSVQSSANDQAGVNVSATDDGHLLFDTSVFVKDDVDGMVKVSMSSESAQGEVTSATTDVTRVMNDLLGAGPDLQTVAIPLHCFTDEGVDLERIQTSFSMELYSQINYDLDNIRLQAGDLSSEELIHTVSCHTTVDPVDPIDPVAPPPPPEPPTEPIDPGTDPIDVPIIDPQPEPPVDPIDPVAPLPPSEPCVPGESCEPTESEEEEDNNEITDPTFSTNFVLYGDGVSSFAMMELTDGTITDSIKGGIGHAGIISTTPSETNDGALHVVVDSSVTTQPDSEAVNATILSRSTSGQPLDLSYTEENGMLLFDIQVFEKGDKNAPVYLSMTSQPEGAEPITAQVKLTSVVNSFTGADPQPVRVPLSCFTDTGMDITNTAEPFSLHVSSDTEYDISNIRLEAGAIDPDNTNYDVVCSSNSDTVSGNHPDNPDDHLIFLAETDGTVNDLSYSVRNTGPTTLTPDGEYLQLTVKDNDNSTNSFNLKFEISDDENNLDLSHYIETGNLEFTLRIDNYGSLPADDLIRVRMEANDLSAPQTRYHPIERFEEEEIGTPQSIKIPLRDLFIKDAPLVNFNQVQNIDTIMTIFVASKIEKANLQFSVADVKLVMTPEPAE